MTATRSIHRALAILAPLCLFFPGPLSAFGPERLDWGDSRQRVTDGLSGAPVLSSPRLIIDHDTLLDTEMTINHRFDEGGLWQIRYFNRARHDDLNEYIVDYERLKTALEAEYGEPDVAGMQWKKKMLADQPEHYGTAIAAGQLIYMSGWETERTRILMILQGEQFRVAHHLIFTDPETEIDW